MVETIKQKFRYPVGSVILAVLLSAPIAFWNVIRDGMPLGYAGMFSLMAEQIVLADFKFPLEVPYYGPGGIPFAYPPVGLYLLAILIKITGKTFIFLRFLPPLLSVLALVPLYFLTLEFTNSKLAGFIAVLLAGASVDLYTLHAWAAGIVRAPAFGLCLACLLFFHRFMDRMRQKDWVLAGVLLGLTVLTHLSYSLFAVLWIAWWNIMNPRFSRLVGSAQIALLAVLVAFPWTWLMLSRYEVTVFAGAFNSHGNTQLLSVFENLCHWPVQIWQGLQPVLTETTFALLITTGIVAQVGKRNLWLPLFFFLVVVLMSDGERFAITIGCMLAGSGAHGIASVVRTLLAKLHPPSSRHLAGLLLFLLVASLWLRGLDRINNYSPVLFSDGFEAGAFFQQNSNSDSVFLALTQQDEAEWMPYLFRRTPLVSQWGSEWLGRYDEQTLQLLEVRVCQKNQDLDCLKTFFDTINHEPDYLLTLKKDKRLNDQIASDSWLLVHQNSRYMIWYKFHP